MKRKVYAFLIKNTFTSWVDPKQKNFYQLPRNLSENTLFAVSKIVGC